MKKMMLVALLMLSIAANAEDAYFGAGYHFGTYDETNVPEANPGALQIKMGKYIGEDVAVEGRVLLGIDSGTVTYFVPIEVDLKNAMSVFIKGDVPISNSGNFYGLFGFSKGKLEASIQGQTVFSEDDSGLSYGLGVEALLGENLYFSGEYILYISESEYDYSGFNIGLHKRF